MKTKFKFLTIYSNSCRDPREQVVARHRSRESCEKYLWSRVCSIRSDGYSHFYYAVQLWEEEDVEVGADVKDLDVNMKGITQYYKDDGVVWFKI